MLHRSTGQLCLPSSRLLWSVGILWLVIFVCLPVSGAHAQLTIDRLVNAGDVSVSPDGDHTSTLIWTNNGLTNISAVTVRVVLSSVDAPDDVFYLGDTATYLSYNFGETNGVTNATVYGFDATNDATSLDASFAVTNAFLSPGVTNEWDLTLSSLSGNSGDVVFNYWRLAVTGDAATNGTIEAGPGGIISASDGYTVTATVSAGSGTGTNAVTAFVTNGQSLNFNGGISGSGELAKTGAGTLSVGASTNFTGIFTLAAGTAWFTSANSLGTGTLIQSNGSSTAVFGAGGAYTQNMSLYRVSFTNGGNTLSGTITNHNTVYDLAAGTTNTLSGFLTGSGGVELTGGGVLAITGTTNNYMGETTISNGTLQVSSVTATNTPGSIGLGGITLSGATASDAVLDYAGASSTNNRILSLSNGGGTIKVATAITLALEGYVDGGSGSGMVLAKSGAGTLSFQMTPDNDFSATTVAINEGTLSAADPDLLSAEVRLGDAGGASAGTYLFDQSGGGATATNNFVVNAGGGAIRVASAALTLSGALSGSGDFSKSGAGLLVLAGGSSYAGTATVGEGTLELARNGGAALASVSSLVVSSGASLLLSQNDQVNNGASVTLSGGTITRAGGVGEVFGDLNLTTGSFIDYGTGAVGTLAFGGYTPSSLLTIQNFGEGNVLSFTSDLRGSINNGSLFSFDNSFTSNWDSGSGTFTVTAIPEPSAWTALAGLLAFLLWSACRRPRSVA